jgi:sugar lactone lactonase YvrE
VSCATDFPVPDVVVRSRASVGEGPFVDPRSGRLCWVDIDNGLLFENDLRTGEQTRWSTHTLLGAAAPRADHDGFAVAVSEGLGLLEDGELTVVDPVLPQPHRRMNDAKCDSRGRLWAGSTHLDFTPGEGALHRWDGRRPSVVVADGFSLPNGLGWNDDDSVMYLADSTRKQLLTARYTSEEGEVGQFGELCSVESGLPDGLAIDLDGCVWVAVWGAYAVHRYDPAGRLIGRVPMPVEKPSSCAFADDGTLFITSASVDLSEQDLVDQPLAGSVFALSTSTRGVPVQPFAG